MGQSKERIPDNKVATQRNDLIHGKQSLSLVQKRIFALTVNQIKREDEELKHYTIQIQDLVKAGTSRNIFSKIEKEVDDLMRKILFKKEEIEGTKYPKTTRWSMVSKAVHNAGEGTLTIRLDPDIKEMLLQLKGNFTPLPVAQLLACRSSYGQRIYELLYSEYWKGPRWEVSLEDLRFSLDTEDKYTNFSDFRRYVLLKAQKDLKKHTNMTFSFDAQSRGKGRKITHIVFDFTIEQDRKTPQLKAAPDRFEPGFNLRERLKENAKLSTEQVNTITRWLAEHQDQQRPLAHWLHRKVECPQPVDGLGRSIKYMQNWAWHKIEKAIASGGFPDKQYNPRGYEVKDG